MASRGIAANCMMATVLNSKLTTFFGGKTVDTKRVGNSKGISRREFIVRLSATGMAVGVASRLSIRPAWGEQKPGANWQQEWERTKAAARKEGRLVIAASAGDVLRNTLSKYFNDKYGLSFDWIVGRSSELLPRISAEQRAGIYSADVCIDGPSTILNFADLAALQPISPLIFLPEALDKKAWFGGDLNYFGKERYGIGLLAFPQPFIFINTDLVKHGEVKGWKDLLNPKWKGKILMGLPTTGAGLDCVWSVSEIVMSPDYLRKLISQEPLIIENPRQQCEWVARGKYPILIGGRQENMTEWINLKSHVELVSSVEGVCIISGAGGISSFKNTPHPNAARLFVNWVLTKEGGTMMSKLIGAQSARVDVPTDFLDPKMVRQPGGKYFSTLTEAAYRQKVEWGKKYPKEIFAHLMK